MFAGASRAAKNRTSKKECQGMGEGDVILGRKENLGMMKTDGDRAGIDRRRRWLRAKRGGEGRTVVAF